MKKIWELRARDKQDRCGNCLKPFKKGELRRIIKNSILRFPNLCLTCKGKNDKL